jgi:pimeloyl-ACP methyl ester carboxylesterase
MRWLAVAAVLAAFAAGCSSSHPSEHVQLTATPGRALYDAPVSVIVDGLHPGERATLVATAVDAYHVTWDSSTTFVASSAGVVDTRQAPVAGSYRGVDPMGIFDRMRPIRNDSDEVVFISPADGYRVWLSVSVAGTQVANTDVQRLDPWGRVRDQPLRLHASGIYGQLYLPRQSTTRRPAVLLFGGSGGGLTEYFAAELLAAHGYPAMTLAYFKEPGLPAHLQDIPLEYFVKALHTLRAAPGVDRRHVFVLGVSRGSEAALLLAAHFPDLVDGVVAAVPSSVVNGSFPTVGHVAWTLGGRPLPHVPPTQFGNPTPPDHRAVIPVERIRGPIVLICGGQDDVWPSCPYSDAIVQRLARHGQQAQVTELKYPSAGHAVGEVIPYVATASAELGPTAPAMGGTVAGDVLGRIDAWRHILTLLASLR